MAKTILLAVDLNAPDQATAPLAEALKLLDGGTLHVASVFPNLRMAQISSYFEEDFEKNALHNIGETLAAWVNEHVPAGTDVHPHVLHGTIYDEILRAAEKLDVDLIVMGSHRPELRDYLLGPNASRVVRHATNSVYVVRS